MILVICYSQELAGVNSPKNGTQKSFMMALHTYGNSEHYRHAALWKDISDHPDVSMVQFCLLFILPGHSIHCLCVDKHLDEGFRYSLLSHHTAVVQHIPL
jgi:hypothetical protein